MNFFSKKAWLDFLFYKVGHQQTDFKLCSTFIGKDENICFTKWRSYLDVQGDSQFIEQVNQRTLLKNEIVFDLDEGNFDNYKKLIQLLKNDGIEFYAYATKLGRARHIHTYWYNMTQLSDFERQKIREYIIQKYCCDLMLKTDSHMIPIEYCTHWKTGELKEIIDKNITRDD